MASLFSACGFCFLVCAFRSATSWKRFKKEVISSGVLMQREAPYIFPDPKDPSKLIGLRSILQRESPGNWRSCEQAQNAWEQPDTGAETGDSDIAMNGIEIPPKEKRCFFPALLYLTDSCRQQSEQR